MVYTHHGTLLGHKKRLRKNKILSFVTTGLALDGIMLSDVSQRQIPFHLMLNLKNKTNKKSRHRPINTQNRLVVATGNGAVGVGKTGKGEGEVRLPLWNEQVTRMTGTAWGI